MEFATENCMFFLLFVNYVLHILYISKIYNKRRQMDTWVHLLRTDC